jgi:hypothetical protein
MRGVLEPAQGPASRFPHSERSLAVEPADARQRARVANRFQRRHSRFLQVRIRTRKRNLDKWLHGVLRAEFTKNGCGANRHCRLWMMKGANQFLLVGFAGGAANVGAAEGAH